MKKMIALTLGIIFGAMSHLAFAQQIPSVVQGPTAQLVEVGNKDCPVSGDKVGQMGKPIKIAYLGKVYNLCCPMCIKTFQKHPEKYSKIAEDQTMAEKR